MHYIILTIKFFQYVHVFLNTNMAAKYSTKSFPVIRLYSHTHKYQFSAYSSPKAPTKYTGKIHHKRLLYFSCYWNIDTINHYLDISFRNAQYLAPCLGMASLLFCFYIVVDIAAFPVLYCVYMSSFILSLSLKVIISTSSGCLSNYGKEHVHSANVIESVAVDNDFALSIDHWLHK